jgi:Na+-driven multidrug efflux pump
MFLTANILSKPLSSLFTGYDVNLYNLTVRAFSIFAFSFLFAGIAIFGSSFFTALNNGLVSALISFLRTLVFQMSAVVILPLLFDVDGIWVSIVIAELMAFIVTFIFIFAKKKQYNY